MECVLVEVRVGADAKATEASRLAAMLLFCHAFVG